MTANTDEIAESWRAEVISALPWQRASNQGDVGAGDLRGFPVVAPGFPGRGFLKPGIAIVDSQRKSYAAREKIAADLAHDLSLPVPPAVLWRRKEHWEEVEPRVVVSLYLYLESIDWALVEYAGKRPLNLDEGEARVLLAATSGMLAFDTWVDQHEHGPPYPGNLVWGYNRQARDSKIVFLDYASALGADGSWTEEGWRTVSAPAMQPLLRANLQPELLERAVASIENVTDESISSIVQRIPDDFLSSERETP